MMKANYSIRSMTRPELDLCIQWAAAEGWNPGLHDADAFYAVLLCPITADNSSA